MTEKMLILKLMDAGEVELLVRKLPREIAEGHFQDDADSIKKILALFPAKKEVSFKMHYQMFQAVVSRVKPDMAKLEEPRGESKNKLLFYNRCYIIACELLMSDKHIYFSRVRA